MKKMFLLLLAIGSISFAQTVSVKSVEQVPLNGKFFFPKLNNSGNKILLTSDNYKGLWLYDLSDKNLKNISDDLGSGYQAQFADDNKSIVYRSDNYINNRKFSSIKVKDLENNQTEILVSGQRNINEPKQISSGKVVYLDNGKLKNIAIKNVSKPSTINSADAAVYIDNSNIVLYKNGEKKILQPLGTGNYIWPSLSPDNTKILFTLAGKGTFVSDLNGNIISEIGFADAPQWSPDGKWIVFMQDKDNGEFVTSSDVYVIPSNGGEKTAITHSVDVKEMYPSWNVKDKIVFNTVDGKIFIVELNID